MRAKLPRLLGIDAALVVVFFLVAFATRNHQDGDYWWIASIGWYGSLITLLILIVLAIAWVVARVEPAGSGGVEPTHDGWRAAPAGTGRHPSFDPPGGARAPTPTTDSRPVSHENARYHAAPVVTSGSTKRSSAAGSSVCR